MTIALFIKEFWHWIVIASLTTSIILLGYKLDAKDSEIAKIKLEHENSLLTSKSAYQEEVIKHQEDVVKLQEQVIETNKDVQEVVNGYHKAIERQSEKTTNTYKEVQTVIPSIVRESCDLGIVWMSNLNNFISTSNSNTFSNTNTDDSK